MHRILFVCLGNICRSPTAEGVFRKLVEDAGRADDFVIDSAGTGAWHAGEPPDPRMTRAAAARGFRLEGRARAVHERDFGRFDLVLAMDHDNLRALEAQCPREHAAKVKLFRDYDPEDPGAGVPDPYYGGPEGFDDVVDIVARTAQRLLESLPR